MHGSRSGGGGWGQVKEDNNDNDNNNKDNDDDNGMDDDKDYNMLREAKMFKILLKNFSNDFYLLSFLNQCQTMDDTFINPSDIWNITGGCSSFSNPRFDKILKKQMEQGRPKQ